MLLWCFLPSCSECRLRRFRLFFPRKDLSEASTSHAEDKKRTTQLCCRWLSTSRAQSPCTQTNLLDSNQLLFSVTKLILLSSSTIAQVIALERFFEIKIYGTPEFEPGTSRTAAECSTTELYPLQYRESTKQSDFTRILATGKKAFVLGVPIIFIVFLLQTSTQALEFFSTQSIVLIQRSRSPKMDTVPFPFTVGYFHFRHGSLCSAKNLLDGSHFFISVTMVILDSSLKNAQMDTSEHFP